jgi:hypothetical protein
MKSLRWARFGIPAVLVAVSPVRPQSRGAEAESVLLDNHDPICRAANAFQIKPRLAASVIFVEQFKNVNWVDRKLDVVFADYGYNSSIGIGQVKVKTAEWIEETLHDPTCQYYPGDDFAKTIPQSGSREDLVKRLNDPWWNAKYVAANLRLILERWERAGVEITSSVDISATLYSTGVVAGDKEKKSPHPNPQPNDFGRLAKRFYESDLLLFWYPR